MAKRSMANQILQKSSTVYPTNGSLPSVLRAKLDLQQGRGHCTDDEIEAKLHGGYVGRRHKVCPECFTAKSANGECNC
jgi:hypothetical protein